MRSAVGDTKTGITRIVFITNVEDISAGSMLIHTMLIGSDDDGAISRHGELERVPHFGDWETRSKELHDLLSEVVMEQTRTSTESPAL